MKAVVPVTYKHSAINCLLKIFGKNSIDLNQNIIILSVINPIYLSLTFLKICEGFPNFMHFRVNLILIFHH